LGDRAGTGEWLAAKKNRAWREVAAIDGQLERGDIDEAGWFEAMQRLITPAYLAASNPRAQSGHSGDAAGWRDARSLICEAVDGDGTLLDVGCANGHLMESLVEWCAERGFRIQPHGVDISRELVSLARSRLPQYAHHIHQGNALYWDPPRRYTYVRTGLEYVPPPRRADLVAHLLDTAVERRLIVGAVNEEPQTPDLERELESLGFVPSGRAERRHVDPRLVRRIVWVDR
jgi:hypothetical protein